MSEKYYKFYIVVTGWNCAEQVYNCVNSLVNQSYQDFEAVFISDGSTDETEHELLKHIPKNHKYSLKIYHENKYAAFRRYEAISEINCDEEDVIITLDMDDCLYSDALDVIKNEYQKGVWMTYGNWINQEGKKNPLSLYYTDEEIKNRDFRKLPYRCVSPNTFKKKLWNKIPESDYIINGEWLKTCTETGFRWSCLEMCGMERVGIIEHPIYLYNTWRNDNSQLRYGLKYKEEVKQIILNQPKKEIYENHPVLYV